MHDYNAFWVIFTSWVTIVVHWITQPSEGRSYHVRSVFQTNGTNLMMPAGKCTRACWTNNEMSVQAVVSQSFFRYNQICLILLLPSSSTEHETENHVEWTVGRWSSLGSLQLWKRRRNWRSNPESVFNLVSDPPISTYSSKKESLL